jgi:cytochrome c-type biogenesis protein CcmH
MSRILALMFVMWCAVVQAEEVMSFANDAQRQLYQQLTAELRCPQCQNQNIADSNAIVAVDMREKTYQFVSEGKDRQFILHYMINRYGDFVHYQPPLTRYTLWLWLLPLLMLLALAATGLYRRTKQPATSEVQTNQALGAELDQLIDRYRSKKP